MIRVGALTINTLIMHLRVAQIFIWVLLLVPAFSYAQYSGEYIDSFIAEIVLEKDSSFSVTERIEYVFTGDKHGIYRFIPTTHPEPPPSSLKERYIDIEVMHVTQDGVPTPFETTYDSGEARVQIGDPQTTITGTHTYEINYRVRGGISFPKNAGADLYWNVTGNAWDVPIRHAEAHLMSPEGLFMRERACYKGAVGISSSCDQVIDDGSGIRFIANDLMVHEGMTVSQSVNRTAVEQVELVRTKSLILIIPLLLIWFIGLSIFVYRYRNANKTGRTIIPQYEPYEGVKPMYTGLLFDGTLDPRDITACIVYLAEQGFISIKKIEYKVIFFFEVDDFAVTLRKPLSESPSEFERSILNLLFAQDAVPGATVTLNELRSNLMEQQANRLELIALKADIEKDLESQGFFQTYISIARLERDSIFLFLIGCFVLVGLTSFIPGGFVFREIFLFGSVGILLFAQRRRTRKGFEALDHLKGFKLFLEMTEKERYDFHNAPEKSPEKFMEYLPYAIAFGVEEKWAEVFKDITIPNPDWYDSGTTANAFAAQNLTTSLGAFSTAFAASSGTSSSSSGGGSSGGGGGGGGGGSW